MTTLAVKILVRALVFGVALTYACNRQKDVKVTPKSYLPIVALVFTILNLALYHLLGMAMNVVTLWTMWFLVPFAANAVLLLATDRILKPFKIDSLIALAKTAGIVTIAHLILRAIQM